MQPDYDLSVSLSGICLRNPLVLASGIHGTSANLLKRFAEAGLGAVTAKSCGPEPREGHPNPVMVEWQGGLLNAIGLSNPGAQAEKALLRSARQLLAPLGVPLIASIFAGTVAEFGQVAEIIAEAQPDMIEVNISCPNVGAEFGLPFSADVESAAGVTRTVKARVGNIPVAVKLAPNVPQIGRIASAVEAAGADLITAINTMPGMVIDAKAARMVLANKSGGISGPALKPIALRCVAEIAQVVDIPIIGTGGVLTGVDAIEMMMAGATAVGIGSVFYYRGEHAVQLIRDEMVAFMKEQQISSIADIIGQALR